MRTKEELKALKKEVETVSKKHSELTEEELAGVSGGAPVAAPSTSARSSQVSSGAVISAPTAALPTAALPNSEQLNGERPSQADGGIVISGVEPHGLDFDYVREAEMLPGAQEIFGQYLNHR